MANNVFANMFKIKDLRSRIFFTIIVLAVFRLGSVLTIPGIDPGALTIYFRQGQGNAFADHMDFFVGGAFSNFSVFMLGVMPYISTQILMQLAMIIFPRLKKIAEEDGGRKKIQVWTRIVTVFVALLQSSAVGTWARAIPGAVVISSPVLHLFITMVTVTTGTMITVWMGEQITARGIGNGISMLIFAGIVARLPQAVWELIKLVSNNELNLVFVIIAFAMFVGIIALVVYEQQGQRKIPVHYAKRVIGRKMYGGQNTYIPFKINPSGVIPIIFASSFLTFPLMLSQMWGSNVSWLASVARFLRSDGWGYNVLYVVLIIFFAYFYTQVALNPTEIAKQIRENGGSIPGIRTDKTEEYLQKILNRLILPGSLYLAAIAVLPTVIQWAFSFPRNISMLMGGTSLLILVGVDLDTMSQVEALLKMHHHDGLLKKGKIRSRNL
ncbi:MULTISPECIES: preprotein translocase subunit SecY [Treponema]|jgi:preprotein translocase, secY subunit|uniref:Protein translocase subunit SecY n=4 Tax=Treponema denticola TaxID=158 RepID=Q73PL2_TREDE|nr:MULTISPECIES: preprotein translocase subunit SecY [Treponema]AAS11278.1 preprotein translocase, SecY subunit [Treponema denticola ATCC 35405]EGC76438.1 preprotein translocase [Treponema denticola F0402]EMB20443.1 preprotein translocase, SecY subunit [Treponema denticola OTK]EMB23187.1 preprotein translocase, SecY subunit [Treponema denticola SP37]EMB27606.1 preprotein translocase, SecY subunit [Treponema denticola MYR-T]